MAPLRRLQSGCATWGVRVGVRSSQIDGYDVVDMETIRIDNGPTDSANSTVSLQEDTPIDMLHELPL